MGRTVRDNEQPLSLNESCTALDSETVETQRELAGG